MSTHADPPLPRRRQFSLRALFVLVGILACLSWPLGYVIRAWSLEPPRCVYVAGLVLANGVPLGNATVCFRPIDGTGRLAFGNTDSQGRFELKTFVSAARIMDGAMPGVYSVTVQEPPPSTPPAWLPSESWIGAIPRDEIPPEWRDYRPWKYASPDTSELNATIAAGGNNNFTFSLFEDF